MPESPCVSSGSRRSQGRNVGGLSPPQGQYLPEMRELYEQRSSDDRPTERAHATDSSADRDR